MASGGEEDTDAVLSDVEDEESVPIVLSKEENISVERYKELLAELEREKKAKEAAVNSKNELTHAFTRLKALAHEAIRKRDESGRLMEEAVRERDEALREKEVVFKEKSEIASQVDELVRARESVKSETDNAVQMFTSGIEKISRKVSNFKNFSNGNELPKLQKYSGLSAVAYGVIKRTNDIVEELVKQIDIVAKSRDDACEKIEQRNYEIAIEVSQLEATISELRDDVTKKTSEIENLGKLVNEKDMKISEMGKDILEKQNVSEKEVSELRQLVDDYDIKLRSLETKMDSQRPLLFEQLNCISRIHDQIYDVIKIVSDDGQSEFSDSLFLPQEMDMDVNLRVSVAAMESIYDLVKTIKEKVRDGFEEKNRETKRSNEIIDQLVKEKQHIGSLLRSALPRQMTLDPTSKTSEVLQVAENGLRKAGINVKLTNILENGENMSSIEKQGSKDSGEDEVYSLAGALENIVKASQVEIIELRHSVEELRVESDLLKGHVEAQAKELAQRKHRIEELEEKERMAEDSIEGLMMDIAAAEEDITRWKLAAEQEAAAGRAVEQDYKVQLSALAKELDEAKQAMVESEKKLKYKEETASAAMAARDAAEKSLRLADLRSSRLSERLEELSRQVEESDPRGDSRLRDRQRYACWPWQLLGINFIRSANQTEAQQQNSNEMELSEPLL